ncbi:MAG TPA: ABC transporter permease [Bordetella sp.]|nr:ABC transporter permease [Bordetella sp.]
MMKERMPGWFIRIAGALVLAFLILPILIIFPLAANPAEYLSFPPTGISWRWFDAVLSDPGWLASLRLSLVVALVSTLCAVLLALAVALALVRNDFRGKRLVYALILMPMIVPHIITSIAVYFFFSAVHIPALAGMIIGHVALAIPVATIIVSATLQAFDIRLEQAALSLGASRLTALRRITLPLIAPGIAAAAIFAFLSSFDELLVALFLSSPEQQTLPVRIWNAVQFQLDPTIAAVSALLILFSAAALAFGNFLQRKEQA